MGMKAWLGVGALTVCAALAQPARADHWTDPDDVSDAAHVLAQEAKQFAKAVEKVAPNNAINDKADDLAEATMVLREVVKSGWGYFFVQDTWKEIQSRYSKLQKAWKNSPKLQSKPQLKKAWKDLRAAYQDLDWAMTSGDNDGGWNGNDDDWDNDDDNDWDSDDDNDWDSDDDNDWDSDDDSDCGGGWTGGDDGWTGGDGNCEDNDDDNDWNGNGNGPSNPGGGISVILL